MFTFVLSNLVEILIKNYTSSYATYIFNFIFREWLWSAREKNSINHIDSNSLDEITKATVLMGSNL